MTTIDMETLVQATRAATSDVFATMLALNLEPEQPFADQSPANPAEGVVSLIGLAGAWVGTGSLSCSASLACRIATSMLMAESPAVNGEVLDVFAEVTNMIVGNIKTVLEERLGPLGLSIPTVVYGKNFATRSASQSQWTVVPFRCGQERLTVSICLAPSRPPHLPMRPGFTQSYTIPG